MARVYVATQGQVITAGMSGVVVDINHAAVWKYMEKHGIGDKTHVFDRVVRLFNLLAEEERDKQEGVNGEPGDYMAGDKGRH